jgi:hypothetical protein
MELTDSITALLNTGVFFRYYPSLDTVPNFHPQHLKCLDDRFLIYMDYKFTYYRTDRKTEYSIMDFSKKNRPRISLEQFLLQTTPKVKEAILFNIDLF